MLKICNHDNFAVIWDNMQGSNCPLCHKDQQEQPQICHRLGCMKMGTTRGKDDTGLRYWMCDDHKKKEAKV